MHAGITSLGRLRRHVHVVVDAMLHGPAAAQSRKRRSDWKLAVKCHVTLPAHPMQRWPFSVPMEVQVLELRDSKQAIVKVSRDQGPLLQYCVPHDAQILLIRKLYR